MKQMTNEYATKVLKRIQYGTTYPVYEALDMAIEALSAQEEDEKPCENCQEFDCYGCDYKR